MQYNLTTITQLLLMENIMEKHICKKVYKTNHKVIIML